jgi:predicted HicB family RNase H-like nuclease
MEGHPRYTIHVSALVFQLAHAHARRAGYPTTSDWLRALLWAWDETPLEPRARRVRHLSVRLSPPLQARLAHIAEVSQVSLSEAFALLVERALLAAVGNDNV